MYNDEMVAKYKELQTKENVIILAIESSCDETSVAILRNGHEVLSNIVSSQIEIHKRFGGVVPEIASRNHLLAIDNVVQEALSVANIKLSDLDAIAVTFGAGLVGALMVGVTFAKTLAYALNIPLIKINHIKAHVSANYIEHPELKPPFMSLVVSGGHSAIVRVDNYLTNTLIGSTIDDAVGEVMDKVSKVLGLGYPGGPIIDKTAKLGQHTITFIPHKIMGDSYNFSFSGLKTAVINYVHKIKQSGGELNIPDICCSFQDEAVDMLVEKSIKATLDYGFKVLTVAGGVSANSLLRAKLTAEGEKHGITVIFPPMKYCTDNAAMVASEAYYNLRENEGLADINVCATPNLNLKYTIGVKTKEC